MLDLNHVSKHFIEFIQTWLILVGFFFPSQEKFLSMGMQGFLEGRK